jgi:hypothetical protein
MTPAVADESAKDFSRPSVEHCGQPPRTEPFGDRFDITSASGDTIFSGVCRQEKQFELDGADGSATLNCGWLRDMAERIGVLVADKASGCSKFDAE